MNQYPEAQKALDKTKITLMLRPDSIFYSTILFSLKQEWNIDIPTAGTNGIILVINPVWFLSLNIDERLGLLVHEVMHVALNHSTRKGNRKLKLFNYAADYKVNEHLIKANYHVPETEFIDSKYDEFNTEQIYAKLLEEMPDNSNGDSGTYGMDVIYTDEKDKAEVEQQVTSTILQAVTQAKMSNSIGSVPGDVLIMLEDKINPKLPWNILLQNYMSQYQKDDYTWKRPNRRYMPEFYLPSLHSEALCNITIAVDSSGSVRDEDFNYFISEIQSIQQNLQPEKITVIDFDYTIRNIHTVTEQTNIFKDIKFTGRGGTDVTELMEWANKNKPTVLLIFTDGDFYEPKVEPTCPVLWLIHDNKDFESKFGEIIHYEIPD